MGSDSALHEETRVQLRTQLEYKTLLNKYKPLLVSFAAMETAEIKEYVIPIEVRVMDNDGNLIYSDDFEWDILNEANNVEQFCQILIQDEGIPQEYLSEISEQIRTQIYNELNWRFICLSNTFKSLLKERELPKLKSTPPFTQTKPRGKSRRTSSSPWTCLYPSTPTPSSAGRWTSTTPRCTTS